MDCAGAFSLILFIIFQLALALADLALQMQSWTTVVTDLIGRFSSDLSTIPVLLDILIVLPEEVCEREICQSEGCTELFISSLSISQINNRSLHLGQNRRRELKKFLGSDCLTVLQLLVACLSSCSNSFEILTRVNLWYRTHNVHS